MKKLLSISIFLTLLPLSFSLAYDSDDYCNNGPHRPANSLAKYGCAVNVLVHTYADQFSRGNYKTVVYSNQPNRAALSKAIIENRIDDARAALAQGQNPNSPVWLATSWCSDSEGIEAPCFNGPIRLLDFAAMVGNVEAIKLLLSSPAIEVNDSADYSSAITEATERAQPAALKLILQDPRLHIGAKTPAVFHLASTAIDFDKTRLADAQEVLRLLLADKRLDPNTREAQPYLYAADPYNPFSRHREGNTTPLMYEALRAHPEMLEVLLQDPRVREGINLRSDSGKTALAIAVVGSKIIDEKSLDAEEEAAAERNYARSIEILKSRGASKGSIIGRIFN